MSDETTTFTPPVAAIPSRAGAAPQPAPMFTDPTSLDPTRRKRTIRAPAPRAVPTTRRKPAKTKKAVAKRKKAPVKKAKKRVRKAAPAPAAPKNPNRPLEMKNRLHAVLIAVATLGKRESTVFGASMEMLDKLTRSERRRVIEALSSVYG